MPRAYLRLDPAYDERKESYPDGPYAALIACFCQGELQPERGRFRNERYLRAILGPRGRHVPYLIEHGDLVRLPDGRLYIDGWDEWQEGDWKVTERVTRIRNRTRGGVTPSVTPGVTVGVTVDETADRLDIAGAERSGAVSGSEAGAERPAPEWDEPEGEAVTWLARNQVYVRPGTPMHQKLVRLVEVRGVNAVVGTFDRLRRMGAVDDRGYIFGAQDMLNPVPKASDAEREERADEERRHHERELARTRRIVEEDAKWRAS
jgi:hypothetical protein